MTTGHDRPTLPAVPIAVSQAAAAIIERIRTERGHELAVLISDGCCDGTAPMLVDAAFVVPDNDVVVGQAAGATVYVSAWAASRYADCELELGLMEGASGGMFSLEAAYRAHLTLTVRRSAAQAPEAADRRFRSIAPATQTHPKAPDQGGSRCP